MAHEEKMLETNQLYDGKILSLFRDTVELENGNTAYREVISHPGGVGIVAVNGDGNILLVRQFRYPFGRELLEIPAGKMERGEDPRLCGIRELREETGCEAAHFESLARLLPSPAYLNEVIHLYLATDLTAVGQDLDADEFLDVVAVSPKDALAAILNGEIADAKTQIGILRYLYTKGHQ